MLMSYLLSLPRASWKTRVVGAVFTLMSLSTLLQQWPDLHDNLTLVRWYAWFNVGSSVLFLPMLLMICLFGRLPKALARGFGGLKRTIPQIHAGNVREQQERRERSREL